MCPKIRFTMIADRRAEVGPWFSVVVEPARGEACLQAIGELDLAASPSLHDQVGDLLTGGFRRVVIDLRRLTFIDLAGVRLLLKLSQDAGDDGWQLTLVGAGGQVRRMLTLTGTLGRLPFRAAVMAPSSLAGVSLSTDASRHFGCGVGGRHV
jgi:anti-sigma B factor antagonist